MSQEQIRENDLWLLSFYRHSEIQGALFFAKVAQLVPSGEIQCDITRHFADESQHARYWTDTIAQLGASPLKISNAYQDRYFAAAGIPHSLMEVLAITQVFEARAIRQYGLHLQADNVHPLVKETLNRIMGDEKWHLSWVNAALKQIEETQSEEKVAQALRRYREADQLVFEQSMQEHGDRIRDLMVR